ncbi:hypothetical protein Glove_174g169 [Diversispora epigaea]|uniref:DUF788-domain-containing protein n=1 Tax=Diversispora epigaea TaxID=1348612 RepID=A0A397IYJ0_9GLOM|nr:hypothetical protein Glove_174g169 [Diversispora epigaea]
MARQSDKKISQENLRYLQNLKICFFIVNGIYFVFRIAYHYDSFTFWIATKYLITCGFSLFLWKQLVSYGSPRFRSNGSVDWPGEDLNAEGLTAYMFDIIYVTWFVHITSMFFEWTWWFYTVIPLFGAYKIWTLFIQPSMFSGGGGGEQSDYQNDKSKRQSKIEKRNQEGKVKYARK